MKFGETILTAILLTLASASTAFAGGATGVGSGGAGCVDANGKVSTLYYCGAYHAPTTTVPPPPPPPLSIDGPSENPADLDALKNDVSNLAYLNARESIVYWMTPSDRRKYFSTVAPPSLTAPIVARIKAEFQHATGIDPKHLVLYAVTDTDAHMDNDPNPISVTYLLPAYFALPTQEQRMVALFHENLWVMYPHDSYADIIGKEMAFEALIQDPTNTAKIMDFIEKMDGAKITPVMMTLILKQDIQTGSLKGFLSPDGTFTNLQLYGPAAACGPHILFNMSDPCITQYENYLDGLRRTYPHSKFLYLAVKKAKEILDKGRVPNKPGHAPEYAEATFVYSLFCYLDGFENCDGRRDLNVTYSNQKATSVSRWNKTWPNDADRGEDGIDHLLWSLAEKDEKFGWLLGVLRGDGSLDGVPPTAKPVTIQINTSSVESFTKGPLSTKPAAPVSVIPKTPEEGAWLYYMDINEDDDFNRLLVSDYVWKHVLPLRSLLGDAALDCLDRESQKLGSESARAAQADRPRLLGECLPLLQAQFQKLITDDPTSLVLRFWAGELKGSMDTRDFGLFKFPKGGHIDDWIRASEKSAKKNKVDVDWWKQNVKFIPVDDDTDHIPSKLGTLGTFEGDDGLILIPLFLEP